MIFDNSKCHCGHYKILHNTQGHCVVCFQSPWHYRACQQFRWRWLKRRHKK